MINSFRAPSDRLKGVALASLAALTAMLFIASNADAQIKQPGAHPNYSVEIEPHGSVWWWDSSHDWNNNSGLGLGLRASIPIVQNGFVSSINNSVAIGFGADWGHYSHRCWWQGNHDLAGNCSNNTFWFPVVMQWNFFFTKAFSLFGEPGVAIRHSRWSWQNGYCGGPGAPYNCDNSDIGIEPVFFVGGRLGNESISFTFRVGWPYASVGASFFL